MLLQEKPAQGANRRIAERFPCRREAVVHLDTAPGGGTRTVLVHNISTHGLCLLMDGPLQLGTTLKVGVPHLNPPHLFHAQVVYAAKQGHAWLIGCALTHILAEDEIQEFLA